MNEVIRLWTHGPPTTIASVPPEVAYTVQNGVAAGMTFYRNISDATLTVFQPSDEAAADQIHADSIAHARKPRAISDIISTDSYLQARCRLRRRRPPSRRGRPGRSGAVQPPT